MQSCHPPGAGARRVWPNAGCRLRSTGRRRFEHGERLGPSRRRGGRHVEDAKRRDVRVEPREQRHRHIVDGDVGVGPALGLTAVRVAVHDEGHRIPIERFLQTARSDERIDLERLALDRRLNRRVVQQRNPLRRAKARQRGFELQRLVDGLVHELLDDRLSPRSERTRPEPATETLDAGDADALQLAGVTVENGQAGIGQNPAHLILLARLEIVIAEHGDGGNPERRQLAGQHRRLFRQAVVGEVAGDQQDVGRLRNSGEERKKCSSRALRAVQIADGSHTDTAHERSTLQNLSQGATVEAAAVAASGEKIAVKHRQCRIARIFTSTASSSYRLQPSVRCPRS